ncbi:putative translation initiation factor eIF-2B subunit gamma [Aphelenchoides bicaudatus]|nr:putative translation initiation factor eIF-2B subunit gamma [Aphelenchoides bicaudatus]
MSKLQAIILAGGKGNRLELVGNNSFDIWDESERALLPVAGVPIFWYPLNVLAKNNITDVLLITNSACLNKIKKLLKDGTLPELPGLKIEIVAPPASTEENEHIEFGSAEVLQMFADRIHQDFLLLTGYFVSDISLDNMIKMHYEKESILTCLLSNTACNAAAPGPKDQQSYRDFVGICEKSNQLVYLQSEEELDPGISELEIDLVNFSKAGNVEFSSAYADCHVYLMDRRLLDLLGSFVSETENFSGERNFSSIKVDLIPTLLDKQFKNDPSLLSLFKRSNLQTLAYELQNGTNAEVPSLFRILGYKATADDASIVGKCNTLGAYLETNKSLLGLKKPFFSALAEPAKYPGTKVSIIKSHIDASSKIGDKEISVVKSSLGKNCTVSNNVKIEESIIMDGVTIGSGSQVKHCVVGRGAKIGANCKLQNCVIESEHVVDQKTNATDLFIQDDKEWDYE